MISALSSACLQAVLAAVPAAADAGEVSRLSLYLPPGLVILLGMVMLFRELGKAHPEEAAAPAPAPADEAPVPAAAEEVPVAVIAAAVAATLQQPHRVVSVTLAPRQLAWSIEGRRQLLTSHQVRR